jgi:hypothetical protein
MLRSTTIDCLKMMLCLALLLPAHSRVRASHKSRSVARAETIRLRNGGLVFSPRGAEIKPELNTRKNTSLRACAPIAASVFNKYVKYADRA